MRNNPSANLLENEGGKAKENRWVSKRKERRKWKERGKKNKGVKGKWKDLKRKWIKIQVKYKNILEYTRIY